MKLFDTTLRDGGNVVGHGFNRELTTLILQGLTENGIQDIEYGNCKGIGAYEQLGSTNACTDEEYLEIAQPFLQGNRIGMFMLAKCADKQKIQMVKDAGLHFIRVGANATDYEGSLKAIEMVKEAGLYCRYSLMKAYVSSAEDLATEAKILQDHGVDAITIMDSAGTMFPNEVAKYVKTMKSSVTIPVGFHGHSNLGLSQANALIACENGADEIDCGLLGMARSAGNCSTEIAVSTLEKAGYLQDVNLYGLLDFLDTKLIPAMQAYNYHTAITPNELILGYAGCHSNFFAKMSEVSNTYHVPLRKLIVEVSKIDRKAPSEELITKVAQQMY